MLMPLTLTLLTAAYPVEKRGQALGIWSAIAGLGVALGPLAGGVLATALSWHWIFWVNVPVGAAVVALAPRLLSESRGRREALDHGGLLLVSGGLLGLVWATVRGNGAGWASPQTLGAYAAGLLLLAAFVRFELRSAHPMLPMRLFGDRRFSTANASAFMLHFAMFGTFFLVIEFLSHVRHEGPVMSGVWTLPWTVMPMLVSPFAGRLARRVQPAAATAAGLALIALGIAAIAALVSPSTAPVALVLPLWSIGIGIGLALPSVVGIAMAAAPAQDIGKASGTLNTARQLGSVFGIAIPVALFQASGSYSSALAATAVAAALGAALSLSLVPSVARLRLVPARA
jgi:EmrB/QacA subfamily drug resistance transporter